jgi:hypothetical protein
MRRLLSIISTCRPNVSILSTGLFYVSITWRNFDISGVYVDFIDTFVSCVENLQKFYIGRPESGFGDIVTALFGALMLQGDSPETGS